MVARVTTTTTPAVLTCSPIQEGTSRTCRKSQPTSRTVSASGRSGTEGRGTSSTRVRRPPALSSRTSPRIPRRQPDGCGPSSAVLAAARPEVVPPAFENPRGASGGARQRESDGRSSRRGRTCNHGQDLLSVPWCPRRRDGNRIEPWRPQPAILVETFRPAPPARRAATPARTRPDEHPRPRSRHRLLQSLTPQVESFTKL